MAYYRVVGDVGPDLGDDRLTDEDGTDIDISGASVALEMWPAGDQSTSYISDDTNGNVSVASTNPAKVNYEFQSGDLDAAGTYYYEWEVTFSGDSDPVTWPSEEGDFGVLVVRE